MVELVTPLKGLQPVDKHMLEHVLPEGTAARG